MIELEHAQWATHRLVSILRANTAQPSRSRLNVVYWSFVGDIIPSFSYSLSSSSSFGRIDSIGTSTIALRRNRQ